VRRILVTGGSGMVGSYTATVFKDNEILSTDIQTLDVRKSQKVMQIVQAFRPDVIVHLAAATDVDRCEQDPDWAFQTNALGTQNIALACQKYDSVMVYISSAAVFNGDKPTPYTEFDVPNPINVYGRSKLAGEQITASLLKRFYIVRAGWMIGGGTKDKKFVGKIASALESGTKQIKAVDDKIGSPTYAKDLFGGIAGLLETDQFGLYHHANAGSCSRYEVAMEIQRIMKMDDVSIVPVSSANFPLPAPRGRSEALQNYKLKLLGFPEQRPWQEALEDYLKSELLPDLQNKQA